MVTSDIPNSEHAPEEASAEEMPVPAACQQRGCDVIYGDFMPFMVIYDICGGSMTFMVIESVIS